MLLLFPSLFTTPYPFRTIRCVTWPVRTRSVAPGIRNAFEARPEARQGRGTT